MNRGAPAFLGNMKVHVFSRTVAAIQVIQRNPTGKGEDTHRFYNADWIPFADQMNTDLSHGSVSEPPECLPKLLSDAAKLGHAWGTYVRVDMYASQQGPIFGEYSSTPNQGRNFTPYADEYFGLIWQRECPDQV
jgi:hypothetical protein